MMAKAMRKAGNVNSCRRIVYALPALAVAGALFYLSSLPDIKLPLEGISFNDLLCHGTAYFIFGVALLIAAHPSERFHTNPTLVYAVLLAVGMVFAMSDEIHQAFVPNRTCSLSDFLADTAGISLALLVRHMIWRSQRFNRLLKSPVLVGSHNNRDHLEE